MNHTFIEKRSKVFKKLSLYTYNEYEPLTNKRCKHKVTGKFFSYKEMSGILKLSVTQIKRVIAEYIKITNPDERINFVLHGNIKQQHSKKYGDDYDQTLLAYYEEFCSELTDKNGLIVPFTLIDFIMFLRDEKKFAFGSYSTVRKRLLAHGIVSFFATRRVKKSIKKKVKDNDETSKIIEQILNFKPREIKRKMILDFGQVVETDACVYEWIPGMLLYIHGIIDSSTGYMLSASLDYQETNQAYAIALSSLYKNYGVPPLIKTDRRRSFYSPDSETKLSQIIRSFGSQIISKSYPTFKSNIERSWANIEKSLMQYLMRHKIDTFEKLNDWINTEFCNWYNERYHKTPGKKSCFKHIDPATINPHFVYSSTTRKCKNGIIKFENNYYYPVNENGIRLTNIASTVTIYRNFFTNEIYIKSRGKRLDLIQCSINDKIEVDNKLELENEHLLKVINQQENKILTLEAELNSLKG